MNTRFNEARNSESGFTLVELLVVIAIIAILTAIAVPAFLNQRKKANDTAVRSDVKTVVTQIETSLVDHNSLLAVTTSGRTATMAFGPTRGSYPVEELTLTLSKGVTITGEGETSPVGAYRVYGYHANGSKYTANTEGNRLVYDSDGGGFTN